MTTARTTYQGGVLSPTGLEGRAITGGCADDDQRQFFWSIRKLAAHPFRVSFAGPLRLCVTVLIIRV